MPVVNRFADLAPAITEWRRDIHRHPEIQFETHRTSALVAEKLRAFGCDEVVTGLGRTGVVGVIRGRSNGSGKVIGLRADMDALPILEETGAPYASETPGAMHACGHDGHTAMLLGAAQYLAETRNFDGTAVLIFQPAEEGGGGGLEMVQDGLMERFGIQEVYGLHNDPTRPLGEFATRPGAYLASSDNFRIEITGRGGHAAYPHTCIDPTVVASQVVLALQTIVARNMDPAKAAVVSVTGLNTEGSAFNVIPERAKLRGTVRALDEETRDFIEGRMKAIVEGTAAAAGAQASLDYIRGYPVTVNHAAQTSFATDVAREISGPDSTLGDVPPVLGAEDFSYMLQARPGAFLFMGIGEGPALHHPKYDFNDEAIPTGCSYWARLVERAMPTAG
ncbi:M20 aminoacylase family protein [Amaricoccus macauensis]|uniref:M20 aminoacylase family protein n=1 Tax=Amaricoccus macauensis TaxID=57001 RepID=UPI003C7CF08F